MTMDRNKDYLIIIIIITIKGMDIREATDKARERSNWRLLVRAHRRRMPDGVQNWK